VQMLNALALLAIALGQPPPPPAAVTATVTGWMECVECSARDLDAVVRLGQPAEQALIEILRNGPAQKQLDDKRQALIAQYQQQATYAQSHPESRPPLTQDQHVALYLRNYRTAYRARAIQGLGAIGTPTAKAALRQVLNQPLTPPLTPIERAAIQKAIQ